MLKRGADPAMLHGGAVVTTQGCCGCWACCPCEQTAQQQSLSADGESTALVRTEHLGSLMRAGSAAFERKRKPHSMQQFLVH